MKRNNIDQKKQYRSKELNTYIYQRLVLNIEKVLKHSKQGYIDLKFIYQKDENGNIIHHNNIESSREWETCKMISNDVDFRQKMEYILDQFKIPNYITINSYLKFDIDKTIVIQFKGKVIDSDRYVTGNYFKTPITDENSKTDPDAGWYFLKGETRHCIATKNGNVFVINPDTLCLIIPT